MKTIYILILIGAITSFNLRGQVIVIDPGHDDDDCSYPECYKTEVEVNTNWDVAVRLEQMTNNYCMWQVFKTKNAFTDDKTISERESAANTIAGNTNEQVYFLSIHCNAQGEITKDNVNSQCIFPTGTAYGHETFYCNHTYNSDNIGLQEYAQNVHNNMITYGGRSNNRNRCVEDYTYFCNRDENGVCTTYFHLGVLDGLSMPNCLSEIDFATTPTQASELLDPTWRHWFAYAYFEAFKETFDQEDDLGITTLIVPSGAKVYTSSEIITLRIHNYGLCQIDFDDNNFTLRVNITGPKNQTIEHVLTTGTILPGYDMDVTFTNRCDLSIPGTYCFNATIVSGNDGDDSNDDMPETCIISEQKNIDPPTGVDASDHLTDRVTISWNLVSDATYYNVFRNTVNNVTTSSSVSNGWIASTESFDDVNVNPGSIYYYWVKAAKSSSGDNQSSYSSPAATGSAYSPCGASFSYTQVGFVYGSYQVDFESAYTGSITNWYWEFDDGDHSTDKNPSHTYSTTGNYNVKLILTNADGIQCSYFRTVYVIDQKSGPIDVDLYSSTTGCITGTDIYLYGQISEFVGNEPFTYEFNLGNGTILKYNNVFSRMLTSKKFTYNSSGKYNVSLTVTDVNGLTGTFSGLEIEIWETPPPFEFFDKIGIENLSCDAIPVGGSVTFMQTTSPPHLVGKNDWYWEVGKTGPEYVNIYYSYIPVVSHTYNTKGKKTVRYFVCYANSDYCASGHVDRTVIVVDCNGNVTTNNFSASISDISNENYKYYAGTFYLENLNYINNYNDKKVELTACEKITLRPGFSTNPSSDNYLKLSANESCLFGGNLKSDISQEYSKENIPALENALVIYPNPTTGLFKISMEIDSDDIRLIEIYNGQGKLVYNRMPEKVPEEFDLGSYTQGLYLIRVILKDNTVKTGKVVLKK